MEEAFIKSIERARELGCNSHKTNTCLDYITQLRADNAALTRRAERLEKALEGIKAGGEMLARMDMAQSSEFPRMIFPYAKDAFGIAKKAIAAEKGE